MIDDDDKNAANVMACIGWALLWGAVAVMLAALLGFL